MIPGVIQSINDEEGEEGGENSEDGEEEESSEEDDDESDSSSDDREIELRETRGKISKKGKAKNALSTSQPQGGSKGGHEELDDDFFKLAEFNAEIEEAEALHVSSGALGGDSDDDDDDDPVDFFAAVDSVEGLEEQDSEDDDHG